MELINEHFFIQGEPYLHFVSRPQDNPYWQEVADFLLDWKENGVLVAHSSGTTGSPKSMKFSAQQVVVSALRTLDAFELHGSKRILMALPVRFIAGKLMLVRAALAGWDLQLAQHPAKPFDGLSGDFHFTALVPHQLQQGIGKVNVEKVLLGGGLLTEELQNSLPPGPVYFQSFGMTETLTHIALRQVVPGKVSGPYKALPGIAFGVDERSALVIHDSKLLDAPLLTQDAVTLVDNQHFYWNGRIDHVINSGGIKFQAEAVEELLLPHLSIPFFVAGLPDDHLGQQLVLIVERGNELFAERALEKPVWPAYMKPKRVVGAQSFHYTESGKLRRHRVLEDLIDE